MMKKRLLITVAIIILPLSLFAKGFSLHFDMGCAMVYEDTFAPFAGISLGIEQSVYGMNVYTRGEYMLSPGGSRSGMNAKMEIMSEVGTRFLWRLFATESTVSHVTFDAGYYTQWVMPAGSDNMLHRFANGLIVRPGISTVLFKDHFYSLELGVGYQMTVYPYLKDYNGLVVTMRTNL